MTGAGLPDGPPEEFSVESANPDDRLDILRVLDAAMLETDAESVDVAIDADSAPGTGEALVARFKRTDAVVGALIATRPEPDRLHVDAVAVRRARRGRGIGSALVAEIVRRAERDPALDLVTAAFDPKLTAFYTDLGFEVGEGDDPRETDRLCGHRPVGSTRDDAEGTGERRR
ncbi:GNAT family N-acetyltransferase [Halorubrum sp. CSM-61]|uniref:GNAT family N-acetyltransferase n=1 Tax=Halorubrum sp. CSM-61 TaxID=2485838 RepID=UPI001F1567B9|nr:GNAT family N-acetyltransferase [Halorubrum sp. CSM-61]